MKNRHEVQRKLVALREGEHWLKLSYVEDVRTLDCLEVKNTTKEDVVMTHLQYGGTWIYDKQAILNHDLEKNGWEFQPIYLATINDQDEYKRQRPFFLHKRPIGQDSAGISEQGQERGERRPDIQSIMDTDDAEYLYQYYIGLTKIQKVAFWIFTGSLIGILIKIATML